MRWLVAACCLLAGCDRVFGSQFEGPDAAGELDLDDDGILDVSDNCIQPPEDLDGDEDGSAPLNGDDACPLDWAHGEDEDSDALPVQCDPLPGIGFDGQRRCFMGFGSGTLNGKLWYSRDGVGWSAGTGELLYDSDSEVTLTMMPVEDLLLARTTTADALFEVTEATSLTEVTLWVAANDPAQDDAGCTVESDTNTWVVRVRGAGPANSVALTAFVAPIRMRIRATWVPHSNGTTLACDAQIVDVTSWVHTEAAIAFPETGRIGFGGRAGTIRVHALDIIEHP